MPVIMPLTANSSGESSMMPREEDGLALELEVRRRERHEPRREDEGDDAEHGGRDGDEVEHLARELPCAGVAFVTGEAREDRDEGAAEGCAGEHLEDEVGDAEGDGVGVVFGADAERVRDDDGAEDAKEARAKEAERDDGGGDGESAGTRPGGGCSRRGGHSA